MGSGMLPQDPRRGGRGVWIMEGGGVDLNESLVREFGGMDEPIVCLQETGSLR